MDMLSRKPIIETKEVIILTKSAKFKNYCVAGIGVETGEWVRLVSGIEDIHGALTEEHMTYEDGTKCQIFDRVKVAYIDKVPTETQPENLLIAEEYYMKKVGEESLDNVVKIHPAEKHHYLFGTRYSAVKSSYLQELNVDYSLALIKVENFAFEKMENSDGYQKLKASFDYNGIRYERMSITDKEYLEPKAGSATSFAEAYLVVSIGEPYNESYYKFVAQIFPTKVFPA